MRFFLPAIAIGLTLFYCTPKKGPSHLLIEANEVHNEALGIYSEAHRLFELIKVKAEDNGDNALVARLDSIHDLLHSWEDGIYEVPGFEHDHGDEGHSHEHSHVIPPPMTDQSMLDYQKNARTAIEEIRDALKELDKN